MNIDKFEMSSAPFEQTLSLRLPSTAMPDEYAASVLKEWNSPLIYAESDRRNFYYDITGRVTLRSRLNTVMTKSEAIGLFSAVADAMLYGDEKGINPKYILLDSDLVFVSEETGSMRFICVPAVNHGLAVKPLRAYIKELIVNMQYDDSENLDYIGKIINYLNQHKRLEPGAFLDYLDSMDASEPKAADNGFEMPSPLPKKTAPVSEEPSVEPVHVLPNSQNDMRAIKVPEPVMEQVPVEVPLPVREDSGSAASAHEALFSAAPVSEEPKPVEPAPMPEENLYFGNIPAGDSGLDKMPLEDIRFGDMPLNDSNGDKVPLEDIRLDPVRPETPPVEPGPQTIVPHMEKPVEFKNSVIPYMIRRKNGEKVVIDKEEFKIGKIPGMADYLLADNPAVSRMHAIIHKIDGSYYICDNYSTNSTFLNGEQLEPGKNYILLSGVRINFANDEFTYYMD